MSDLLLAAMNLPHVVLHRCLAKSDEAAGVPNHHVALAVDARNACFQLFDDLSGNSQVLSSPLPSVLLMKWTARFLTAFLSAGWFLCPAPGPPRVSCALQSRDCGLPASKFGSLLSFFL